jgi:hypothetical protein
MAFVKIGDPSPVIEYYDNEGEKKICTKCGKELVVVALDRNNNTLICEDCDDEEISE